MADGENGCRKSLIGIFGSFLSIFEIKLHQVKKYLLFFLLLLFSINGFSQGESIGMTASNYAGVNSTLLNPSAMHNQKLWLSFNLISANAFLHTDYIFLARDDFKLLNLFRPDFTIAEHPTGYGSEQRNFYSFDNQKNTSLDQSLRILGPSLMISFNQHAVSVTTALRMEINIRNISPDLGNILAYGFSYYPQYLDEYQVKDFNGTAMAWSEIGISYAYRTNKEKFGGWSFGFSLKRLYGAGGGYLNVPHSTYTLIDSKNIDVSNQSAELGFSAPLDFDTDQFLPNSLVNGKGWGMDIGFTYQSFLSRQAKLNAHQFCEQALTPYKYRIGLALLDVGSIQFKKNAQTHNFSNPTQVSGDMSGVSLENVNQVIGLISERYYGSASQSLVSNTLKIALPMALSAQFDYNTERSHLYLNASLIYGIPLSGGALRRPSQLSISPRYETKFLELALPLSFYQFRYPHLGVYVRIGAFSLGSDWLSSLLGPKQFQGMDFYFSSKFQIGKQNCRSKRNSREACGDKSGRFIWSN